MKPYIIAVFLFVTGFLILGVLTANLMEPPKPKPQAHVVPPQKPAGGYAPTGPQEPSYPAAMPQTHAPGTQPAGPGTTATTPGMASTMPGTPSTGVPPVAGSLPGASAPIGVSTAVAPPKPVAIEPTSPVPIIQPDDLGSGNSPTRGRNHE